MTDTIAAIATAQGVGAIAIIRVSGSNAINITNSITKFKRLNNVNSHTINYDYIIDNDKIIDEVLITVMKSPKTFTCEDVVEINTHGGIATTNKVLELLLENGCRLAEPGEFTKRAFLNGRIDLIQAESVMDLINAKTDKVRDLALNQLNGKVSNMIKDLRQDIVSLLSNIEVNIDYPEYEDISVVTKEEVKNKIDLIEKNITKIIKESENSKIIKEGINTAIIGKPNVGKSSLLNKLLNEEKAIVTEIEGTTRDIVEGTINLDGIILNIIDTAGIRKTSDIVESIGVKKSFDMIEKADLVLYILNNNELMDNDDLALLEKIKKKNHVVIINKIDLENKLNYEKIDTQNIIKMSTLNNIGIDDVKDKIKELFHLEKLETTDPTYLTNARSIAILKQALKSIDDVKNGLALDTPIDMLEIDIKNIWELLGEIIGETYQDALIDELFKRFCLGK